MLLFRALSTRDISNIDLGIYCSLFHSYLELENSKIKGNKFGTKEYKSLSKSEKNIYNFFWNIFRNEHDNELYEYSTEKECYVNGDKKLVLKK